MVQKAKSWCGRVSSVLVGFVLGLFAHHGTAGAEANSVKNIPSKQINVTRNTSITSTPRDNSITSAPKDSSITSIPRDTSIADGVVSFPKDSSITSMPRDTSITYMPVLFIPTALSGVQIETNLFNYLSKGREVEKENFIHWGEANALPNLTMQEYTIFRLETLNKRLDAIEGAIK